jgi:hypothetical protein
MATRNKEVRRWWIMADEAVRLLDATDATQVVDAVREWINGLGVLTGHLYLEYVENGPFGYCIKADGGSVTEEDIAGDFTAEVPFEIHYTVNYTADDPTIYKPLNDLSAWFKANGTTGLDLGDRRTPDSIKTIKGPSDMSGLDEDGNVTFFSVYQLTYDEEAI